MASTSLNKLSAAKLGTVFGVEMAGVGPEVTGVGAWALFFSLSYRVIELLGFCRCCCCFLLP